ncbi:hypothetical protein QT17_10295 [Thermus sp. 2.9]|uniref:helix-turn-helix domain-containing protein n=1 Tax=Thermus sp. (strain 2.9) TaxID=1577051 RepID=UPI000543F40C|nr:helix-turn-helix domain-containing protein [Thermus sp. 2.9]KHG64810.1 hypothetical protein QT17_10295 [Thermus sp. 2.9]
MPRLMTADEAAEYLGIPVAYIYEAVRAKPGRPTYLKHLRFGKTFYFKPEWLDEWTERLATDVVPMTLRRAE